MNPFQNPAQGRMRNLKEMKMLRDGAGELAAKRVRRAAWAIGHFLGRFRASQDNHADNKYGDTYCAECQLCGKAVLIEFGPFATDEEEAMAVSATSKRFGRVSTRRYYVSMPPFCRHA